MAKSRNIVPALLLLGACASTLRSDDVRRGTYFVEVMGKTLTIDDERMRQSGSCILGSADDATLERLRRAGYERRLSITYEVLPMPDFASTGGMISERIGVVRGQLVAPWCESAEFYWVRSFRFAD